MSERSGIHTVSASGDTARSHEQPVVDPLWMGIANGLAMALLFWESVALFFIWLF